MSAQFSPIKGYVTKVFVELHQVKSNNGVNISQCTDCVKNSVKSEIVDKVSVINGNLQLKVTNC